MANVPRASSIGLKHKVVSPKPPHDDTPFWRITGPSLDDELIVMNERDAETVAAALNFAWNFEAIKRKAAVLADQLNYLQDFK